MLGLYWKNISHLSLAEVLGQTSLENPSSLWRRQSSVAQPFDRKIEGIVAYILGVFLKLLIHQLQKRQCAYIDDCLLCLILSVLNRIELLVLSLFVYVLEAHNHHF